MPNLDQIKTKVKNIIGNENYEKLKEIKKKTLGTIIPIIITKFQELTGQNPSNSTPTEAPTTIPSQPNTIPAPQTSQQIPQPILPNTQQTPENEQIPIFNPEDFQKEKKLSLKGISDNQFTGEPKTWQIPIDQLKNGAKIKLWSNRKHYRGKNVEFAQNSTEYTLTYVVSKDKKGNETGKWEITEPTKCCDDFKVNNGRFVGINGAIQLENGELILSKPDLLKDPELKLNIQYLKPDLTNEEIAQIENKKQEEKYKQHSKTFQDLTKDVSYKDGNYLVPHETALENTTRIPCAKAYFDAQDFSDRKEERQKVQGKRAEDFESFNKLLDTGQTGINNLTPQTTAKDFLNSLDPNGQNSQNSQNSGQNQTQTQNQLQDSIYQEYLTESKIGGQSEFVSRLAEKMTRQIFPVDQFSDEIINQNPILPNLDDIFGKGLGSIIPQMAVHLSKITLNPKPFNFDQINFAGGWLITDQKNDDVFTGGVLMTVEQILAVATYQFFRVKIELQMKQITQDEITNKESLKNQHKTDFLNKIRTINKKIIEHKTQQEMTDEQFEELKMKINVRYSQNTNPKNITLEYLCSLLNLGDLHSITDQNASDLGLNFENPNEIQTQNTMLTELEKACDYVISLENATKNLQELTQKFTEIQTKIQEKNPAFSIIEEIVKITTPNNKKGARNYLNQITTDGKIDNQKAQQTEISLANLTIKSLEARKNWYNLLLDKIKTINEEFDVKIKKESE